MFLALEAGSGVGTDGMTAVMGAMDTIVELMGKVWTLMTSNPFLTVMVATALIPVGVGAFCAIRNAARG